MPWRLSPTLVKELCAQPTLLPVDRHTMTGRTHQPELKNLVITWSRGRQDAVEYEAEGHVY